MNAGPEDIARAIALLRAGDLVAFPTETVYGLGADALNADAIARVFQRKGRPSTNPLIVHVSGIEMARAVAASWTPLADTLARAVWPGPLTLVVPKATHIPPAVTAGGDTVAIRCPDHPLTLALLEAFGSPLVGPSANRSGAVSPTTPDHVRAEFGEGVFVLDGGPCARGLESTVLSLVEDPPRVLRRGVLDAASLSELAGIQILEPPAAAEPGPARSPGIVGPHYRPSAPLHLIESPSALRDRFQTGRTVLIKPTEPVVDATTDPESESPAEPHDPNLIRIPLPADAAGFAAGLYAAMREADAHRPDRILLQLPAARRDSDAGLWAAIEDRLARAATPIDS